MDKLQVLVQMILTVKSPLFKRPFMARLVIVRLKMCLIRLGLAAEYAAHASGLEFYCLRTVQGAHPLFDRKMQRLLVPLPIMLCLEVFGAKRALVW